MKKVGSRGFSLIELLAVVVILGVLSAVGIGAYSRIVTKSKLEAYLDVVKLQAKEASKLVNAGDYYADDDNTVYYFDYKIFDDDKSMQSLLENGLMLMLQLYLMVINITIIG